MGTLLWSLSGERPQVFLMVKFSAEQVGCLEALKGSASMIQHGVTEPSSVSRPDSILLSNMR